MLIMTNMSKMPNMTNTHSTARHSTTRLLLLGAGAGGMGAGAFVVRYFFGGGSRGAAIVN
jgi:hypothetical protein